MARNFYKQDGSYYYSDTNQRVLNIPELQEASRAGGIEIQPPQTPPGAGNVESNLSGTTYNQVNTPAPTPQTFGSGGTDYGKFGMALMDLLKQQQQLGTRGFAEQGFNAQEAQANRVLAKTPDELIGANPNLQSQVRSASAGAVSPTISGARSSQQTFSEQIAGLGNALNQAQGIGQWLQGLERQDKEDALNLMFKFPEAVKNMDDDAKKKFAKLAGVNVDFIDAIPNTVSNQGPSITEQLAAAKAGYDIKDGQITPKTYESTGTISPSDKTGGSVSWRTNNPGNIKWGEFAKSLGAVDSGIQATDGGTFASFESEDAGKAAQIQLLKTAYSNLPLEQAMKRWSGNGYGADVAPDLPSNIKIGELNDQQFNYLLDSMKTREGWKEGTVAGGSLADLQLQSDIAQIRNGLLTKGDATDIKEKYFNDPQKLQQITDAFNDPKTKAITATQATKYDVPNDITGWQLDNILKAREANGYGNQSFQELHDSSGNKEYQNIIQWLETKEDMTNIRALKQGGEYIKTLSPEEQQRIFNEYRDAFGVNSVQELLNVGDVNTGPFTGRTLGIRETAVPGASDKERRQIALDVISGKYTIDFMREISGVAISQQEAARLQKLVPNIRLNDKRFVEAAKDAEDGIERNLLAAANKFGFNTIEELGQATQLTRNGQYWNIDNQVLEAIANGSELDFSQQTGLSDEEAYQEYLNILNQ
ncbi:hypothetical protein M0R04_10710 [Candidatus Dojkabacteria bacterium]|jgi:hypothetical protein|nr:hypothetical protein [Candidatus Dojkabacteria bacterium]